MDKETRLLLQAAWVNTHLLSRVLFRLQHGDSADVMDTSGLAIEDELLAEAHRAQEAISEILGWPES